MRHIFLKDLIEINKQKMSSLLNKHKMSSLLSPFHFDKCVNPQHWNYSTEVPPGYCTKIIQKKSFLIFFSKNIFYLARRVIIIFFSRHYLDSPLYMEKRRASMRCVYIQNSSFTYIVDVFCMWLRSILDRALHRNEFQLLEAG